MKEAEKEYTQEKSSGSAISNDAIRELARNLTQNEGKEAVMAWLQVIYF